MATVVAEKVIRIDVIASAAAQQNIRALGQEMEKVDKNVQKLKNSVDSGFGGILRSISSVSRVAGLLGISFGFAEIISSTLKAADTFSVLEGRFKALLGSSRAAGTAIDDVIGISRRTGGALESTAKLYEKVIRAGERFGVTQSQARLITEGFSNSLRLSGASTQEASAALIQFGQVLQSGRFQGDEFRSLSENASVFVSEFAKAIGVTVAELRKMGTEGKLTSELLFSTFFKMGKDNLNLLERFNSEAAKIPLTLGQAATAIASEFTGAIGQLNAVLTGNNNPLVTFLENVALKIGLLGRELKALREEADAANLGGFGRFVELMQILLKAVPNLGALTAIPSLFGSIFKQFDKSESNSISERLQGIEKDILSAEKKVALAQQKTVGGFALFENDRQRLDNLEKEKAKLNELIKTRDKLNELAAKRLTDFPSRLPPTTLKFPKEDGDGKAKKETDFERELKRLTEDLLNLKSGADETKSAFLRLVDALAAGKLDIKSEKERNKLKELAKQIDAVKAAKEREVFFDTLRTNLSEQRAKTIADEAIARAKEVSAVAEGNEKLREEIEVLREGKKGQDELAVSKLHNSIASKELALSIGQLNKIDGDYLESLQTEIRLLRDRTGLVARKEAATMVVDNDKLRDEIELLRAGKKGHDEVEISKIKSAIASKELALANARLNAIESNRVKTLKEEIDLLHKEEEALIGSKAKQEQLAASKIKNAVASKEIALATAQRSGANAETLSNLQRELDLLRIEATALSASKIGQDELTASKVKSAIASKELALAGATAGHLATLQSEVVLLNEVAAALVSGKKEQEEFTASKIKSALAAKELALASAQRGGADVGNLGALQSEVVLLREVAAALSAGKIGHDELTVSKIKSTLASKELALANAQRGGADSGVLNALQSEITLLREQVGALNSSKKELDEVAIGRNKNAIAVKELALATAAANGADVRHLDTLQSELVVLREEAEVLKTGIDGQNAAATSKIRNAIASKELALASAQLNAADTEYTKTLEAQIVTLKERIPLVSDKASLTEADALRKKMEDEEKDRVKRLSTSFIENFRASKDMGKAIIDTIREQLATRIFEVVVNPLIDPFMKNIERAIEQIAAFLHDALTEALRNVEAQKGLSGFLQGLFGGGGFGTGSGFGNQDYGQFLAKGGAYKDGQRVEKYAGGGIFGRYGGVMRNPTLFKTGSGFGLGGEAGTEAVMPLGRTTRGELGVMNAGARSGSGQPYSINMPVTVENNTGTAVQARTERDPMSGGMRLILTKAVRDVVSGDLSRGDGITSSFSKRFSLNPAHGSPVTGR